MVEAIRFWAMATKVIVRKSHPERSRLSVYAPTRIGRALLDDAVGFDPYVEDITTLWILHWQAISAPSFLPLWRLLFNDFNAIEFSEAEIFKYCRDEIASTTWSLPTDASIRKDIDCLLRMYGRRRSRGRETLDDHLDSPFSALELIRFSPGAGGESYRLVRGTKRSLTAAAIVYSCLDFMSRDGKNVRTISTSRLAGDAGSPGRILKVTESDIADAIEETARRVAGLNLVRPAGLRQLTVDSDPSLVALAVLCAQYEVAEDRLSATAALDVAGPDCTESVLSDAEVAELLRRQDAKLASEAKDSDAA